MDNRMKLEHSETYKDFVIKIWSRDYYGQPEYGWTVDTMNPYFSAASIQECVEDAKFYIDFEGANNGLVFRLAQ